MATLINNSSGNFTTAGTWSLVDSTSLLDSETNTTNTTTSFVGSSTFSYVSPPTIDGIGVKVSARSAAPTGTFSVRLFDGTSAVTGTTVTINVTDLVAINGSTNIGWVFMAFAAPVALIASTNYSVQVQSSTNAQVTLYRDATAANWSRILRTTTTQAPASGDNLIVAGDRTGAGTGNSYTVTMDNADAGATTFGNVQVCGRGTLAYGTAASTNYYLKLGGNLTVYTNAIYTQGTVGTPIPSTSTAKLEFACTSNVQFGLEGRLGYNIQTQGNAITNSALLAADAAASATSLTTNISTGWKNGDVIGIASTTRTKGESESKALTADASGTTLTIAALTNAHSGSDATQAELINLTRNVQIFSTSTTNQTYINLLGTGIGSFQATEFYNMGSATALKRGIDVGTTTGSFVMNNCSVHDFNVTSSLGVNFNSGSGNNFTMTNCVVYNIANTGINLVNSSGTTHTLDNIIVMLTGATGFNLADLTGTALTNLTAVSATGAGITLSDSNGTAGNVFGTCNNLTSHSNSTIGISMSTIFAVTNNPYGTFTHFTCWRNTTNGLNISNVFAIIVDTVTAFGNGTANVTFGGVDCSTIILKNMTLNAGTTLTCPIGLNITGDTYNTFIDTSTFGSTTTHATGDVNISGVGICPQVVLRNCVRNSTTKLSNPGNMTEGGFVSSARDQQTAGSHLTTKKYGTINVDTTIFNKGSPSSRMTPNNAASTNKLQGGVKKFAVPNGQTAIVSVFLRKSVAGDGSAYNGNQPRLILKADPAVGITSDTVLATADNTYNGTFKALTGTTPAITDDAVFQVYIDCDGTSGWINVDDWSVNS